MKTQNKADVGVIVARFQIPYLHDAFVELIQGVVDQHDNTVIVLGLSAIPSTKNNPLDFKARSKMITALFPDIDIIFLKDVASDELWSSNLDYNLSNVISICHSVLLYGSGYTVVDRYCGRHNIEELDTGRMISYEELCKKVINKPKYTNDFRAGVVWATSNKYPTSFTTVDIAIIDDTTPVRRVLLARKKNETKYRFVGGFSDPDDDCFEDSATREVKEETTLDVTDVKYVQSIKIDDWRYRHEEDKIKTILFTAQYKTGTPVAKDDIVEVRWFLPRELNDSIFVDEHKVLFHALLNALHV
jgi:bifunctional NMN adenylyltransferase/nudix hydrolase